MKQYFSNTWVFSNLSIVYRILRGFVRALIFRKNTLKVIEIYPTFDCNSKCVMCSISKCKDLDMQPLTLPEYENIAKEGAKQGAIAVSILGGEPLLYKHLAKIVELFKKYGFFVAVVSNSFLFSEEKAHELKCAGLDLIYFSLESLDEKENDEIRGVSGHYASVMRAITIAKKNKVRAGLATVIVPGGLERFKSILDYARENSLLLSCGELAQVGCAENSNLSCVSEAENLELKKIISNNKYLTTDWAMSYFLKFRCPAGKEKIGITTYGDVIGCSLTMLSFGNIRKEPLVNILKRIGSFKWYKDDSDRCLAAADHGFIKECIIPLASYEKHPVPYEKLFEK